MAPGSSDPTPSLLDAATAAIEAAFDATNGGWGRAPKFPQPMTIEFLLRRHVATGDQRPLAVARRSLDAMADGGVHDQLGGGFHRYSTDAEWLVPHFEQMLYDNAQLARVYVHAWALTGDARYRAVATGTLDYMLRELRTPDGAFAASQDADTEGIEGLTFTWRATEVADVLGEDAPLFEAAYGVTEAGNWEGVTILSRVVSDDELADGLWLRRSRRLRARLAQRPGAAPRTTRRAAATRARRQGARGVERTCDRGLRGRGCRLRGDRCRTSPGGIARLPQAAAETVVAGLLSPEGVLRRSWKDGRAVGQGVLEDYTHLADGLLALYEATFDERWFTVARGLMDRVLARFADPAGGFFDTADDHERLVTRPKDVQDNAVPSGNAMAARVLLRLAAWTGEGRYRDAAERALRTVVAFVEPVPDRVSRSGSLRWTWRSRRDSRSRSSGRSTTRRREACSPRSGAGSAEPGGLGGSGPGRERGAVARRPRRGRWPADRVCVPSVRLPAAGDGCRGAPGAARRPDRWLMRRRRPASPMRTLPPPTRPWVPLPAATVVLLRPRRDGLEALLTHRPTTMAFAADMHVFPGGRVDSRGRRRGAAHGPSVRRPDAAAAALGGDVDEDRPWRPHRRDPRALRRGRRSSRRHAR